MYVELASCTDALWAHYTTSEEEDCITRPRVSACKADVELAMFQFVSVKFIVYLFKIH